MKTILVVDNDADVRRLLQTVVPSFGHAIVTAANGAKAVEVYRSRKIDFVLLDIRMLGMDGPETLAALRKIDPEVVCCLMSASASLTVDEMERLGAVGFLAKPFHLDELRELIACQVDDSAIAKLPQAAAS